MGIIGKTQGVISEIAPQKTPASRKLQRSVSPPVATAPFWLTMRLARASMRFLYSSWETLMRPPANASSLLGVAGAAESLAFGGMEGDSPLSSTSAGGGIFS